MLNLVTPIQETKAYQSIFAEGEAKGEETGLAKGKLLGKAEGKADDLKRLLRRRFDNLPAWAEQRIDTASIAQLDAWLDGIFDAPKPGGLDRLRPELIRVAQHPFRPTGRCRAGATAGSGFEP